jgi:hypothetical protein
MEEVDLVLAAYARRIGGGAPHTEMKVDYSRIDGGINSVRRMVWPFQ